MSQPEATSVVVINPKLLKDPSFLARALMDTMDFMTQMPEVKDEQQQKTALAHWQHLQRLLEKAKPFLTAYHSVLIADRMATVEADWRQKGVKFDNPTTETH